MREAGRTGGEEEGGQALYGRKGIFPRALLPPCPCTHSRAVCAATELAPSMHVQVALHCIGA